MNLESLLAHPSSTAELHPNSLRRPWGIASAIAACFHFIRGPRSSAPPSIINPPRRRREKTSGLYVLEVDFKVMGRAEIAAGLDEALKPIREKYGLDFVILEPGMKLKRFDDF